uniref:Metalloendopeptidase n=1 Tax=Panagrolaimus davidi TaxID=227884 RepID=A0A914QXE5_9BILA
MKIQSLLFSIAGQLFRSVFPPDEVAEAAYQTHKLKTVQQQNSDAASDPNVALNYVTENRQNNVELEHSQNGIFENRGIDNILYDGDMLLTANQRDYLIDAEEKTQKTSGREKRQAIAVSESGLQIFNKTKPIFYIFTKSFSNPESRQTFHNVMDYLNSYTCLNITEGKSFVEGEQNVKVTTHPNYCCFGSIGYTGYGGDGIRLGKGCEEFYPISHEMLHNLGFYHTHQRHDRDDYVRIMIGPSHPNYNLLTKVTELENDNFGLPYDLGSIMHYVSTYPNGTMNAIDETKKYSVGATDNGLVAFSDLKMLNALYSCQESCPTSPECKNQGFRNPKDCNVCVCPRGFKGNDCTVPQFSKDTNETCGGILQAQASLQTFNSSMNSYTNSSENRPTLSTCFWHITAPEGKAIKVKLNSYSGSQSTAPCKVIGLEVRVDTFEIVGARICHPDMIEPTLEYNAPSNLAIVAAFTANNPINYSFSYWFVDQPPTTTTTTTTTTKPPTTTEDPRSFTPLNCSGAMDLVFVIDVCTTTEENLNLVKSQLEYAIKQNGIKWESTDNNTARLGIILSATSFADGVTTPYRYLDFQGHQTSPYQRPKLVTRTIHLKQVFRDIAFDLGINDIGLSMNYSINGDYVTPNLPFGDPIFGSEGDRPNVPNAMIVITGADTSNVTLPSALLRNSNVDIYSIGFEDVSMAHLQAISGNPAKAFSTTRVNLANTISNICAGFLNE